MNALFIWKAGLLSNGITSSCCEIGFSFVVSFQFSSLITSLSELYSFGESVENVLRVTFCFEGNGIKALAYTTKYYDFFFKKLIYCIQDIQTDITVISTYLDI